VTIDADGIANPEQQHDKMIRIKEMLKS